MDNKKIQATLKEALEEEVPSAEIHLWPAVKNLVAGSQQQGVTKMNTPLMRRVPRVAFAILVIVGLFGLMLTIPQVRAFAQEILQFFTRAESDTFPLDLEQFPPVPEDNAEDPENILNANKTVSEVESLVGFDVLEPTWLPDTLTFRGANFKPESDIAYLFYNYIEVETNGLILREESFQTRDDCELCGLVGARAVIKTVQIGNVSGEYVEGVWKLNGQEAVWESDPYLKRMRWQVNGMAFELQFMGPPDAVTQADMVAIAESLSPSSALSEQPTAEPPSPLISVAEAEAQVGFDVAELSSVPKGFEYLGVRMYGNIVSVEYQAIGLGGNLIITQSREGYNESEWDSVPEEFVVPVKIGELDGEFVQGAFVVYPNAAEATWNLDAAMWRLRWEKDGIYYEIAKYGDVQLIEYLDQAGMIALAEDLMGQGR